MKEKSAKNGKVPLAPLKVKSIVRNVAEKGSIPTILIEGDYAQKYNEAAAKVKEAEELVAELKPLMRPVALDELYERNAQKPWDAISSVKLEDEEGGVTRVTFMGKYSAIPEVAVDEVEAVFGEIKTRAGKTPNINDYLVRTMVGKFDTNAFIGPDGRFSKERYEAITAALETVCQRLQIANPLSTAEVITPIPDFHARRWVDFDAEANKRLTKALPNQVSFFPCPPAAAAAQSK